jgi:bifunctional non-homologous end joining protein LigD
MCEHFPVAEVAGNAGEDPSAAKDPGAAKGPSAAKGRSRSPKGAHGEPVTVEVDGHDVTVTNPEKVFFSARGETKLDLVRYYVAVGPGALRGVLHRPVVLKRFPDGAEGPSFFQKRMPATRPEWLETVTVTFPSGRSAEELCPADVAHIAWAANLGCLDLNPWPVRSVDLDHPDELRVDLDPQPGVAFDVVRQVALAAREVLDEHGLGGFPKTSGSRGIHVVVPITPAHGFTEVRRAALALARELERRLPDAATSAWWKEERGERVLVDYNQNARDRTVASAYSVRNNPEGRVSCPLDWSEVPDVDPADLTLATVPARYAERGDPFETIDDRRYDIGPLLELAARDEAGGLGDAPWPPHFPKQEGEPHRAAPSRSRRKAN